MKLFGWSPGGEKKKNETVPVDETWKKVKDAVDNVFEMTKTDRDQMKSNLSHYNGNIWNDKELREDESKAFVNLFFSTVQSIAPMLSDNRPIWMIIAKDDHLQNLANAYNMAGKYAWDKLDMSMTLHEVVIDAMVQKVGIFKVYFDYGEGFGGELCIESVEPQTFFLAPGYTDPWKAPWCGEKIKKPLSFLRRRFPDVDEIEPDNEDGFKGISYGTANDFELDKYFATIYEVWMRDEDAYEELEEEEEYDDAGEKKKRKKKKQKYPNGKFMYFTAKQYLGTEPADPFHGKPPYVPYYNYKKPHDFLGTSEGDNIIGLCKEFNLQFQKVVGHARKYSDPNVFYDVNQIPEDQKLRDTFNKGGNLYPYDGQNSQGRVPVQFVQPTPLVNDTYNLLGMIPKLIEEETGATDVSKGIASKKQRQSASEIAILVESSYTRTRQRVRNLEWSLKRVFWILVNLMQQYYSEVRPVKIKKDDSVVSDYISNSRDFAAQTIANPKTLQKANDGEKLNQDEEKEWEDYTKLIKAFGESDPVLFEYDIEIQTNSSLPLDKQSLANLAVRLYQLKGIDRKALLETLQFPRWEDVSDRMDEVEQAAKNPQGVPQMGGSPSQGGLGAQNPTDIQDQLSQMMGGNAQGVSNE